MGVVFTGSRSPVALENAPPPPVPTAAPTLGSTPAPTAAPTKPSVPFPDQVNLTAVYDDPALKDLTDTQKELSNNIIKEALNRNDGEAPAGSNFFMAWLYKAAAFFNRLFNHFDWQHPIDSIMAAWDSSHDKTSLKQLQWAADKIDTQLKQKGFTPAQADAISGMTEKGPMPTNKHSVFAQIWPSLGLPLGTTTSLNYQPGSNTFTPPLTTPPVPADPSLTQPRR